MTYRELLHGGGRFLEAHGIAEAAADAWVLFEAVTGTDRTHYFLRQADDCTREEQARYRELLKERAKHIPVQYLTGWQEFMGYPFRVNETVLIPRQDTELLVLEAEKKIRPGDRVLDVCTGSGCIIISLAKRVRIQAEALDISAEALRTAAGNAGALSADVRFFCSDLLACAEGTYDCIVSNPPYIPSEEIAGLMPEVSLYEPRLALDGGSGGLQFYRRITREARRFLKPGGWLLFEIGCSQGQDVSALMREQGYCGIEVKKDLAGLDRVVSGRLP